jgi:hypothetical protein
MPLSSAVPHAVAAALIAAKTAITDPVVTRIHTAVVVSAEPRSHEEAPIQTPATRFTHSTFRSFRSVRALITDLL